MPARVHASSSAPQRVWHPIVDNLCDIVLTELKFCEIAVAVLMQAEPQTDGPAEARRLAAAASPEDFVWLWKIDLQAASTDAVQSF